MEASAAALYIWKNVNVKYGRTSTSNMEERQRQIWKNVNVK